jgi:hypothetical protein
MTAEKSCHRAHAGVDFRCLPAESFSRREVPQLTTLGNSVLRTIFDGVDVSGHIELGKARGERANRTKAQP